MRLPPLLITCCFFLFLVVPKLIYLREFALCYERHPESMRGLSGFWLPAVIPFPRIRGSADSADLSFFGGPASAIR